MPITRIQMRIETNARTGGRRQRNAYYSPEVVQDVIAGEGYRATAGDAEDNAANDDKGSGYKTAVGWGWGVAMILMEMQETLEEIGAN